jgi:hypothetical protein
VSALEAFVTELAQRPEWAPLRGELVRLRDQKARRLVQYQGSHEEMLAVAGEIRGLDLALSTLTLKGQEP